MPRTQPERQRGPSSFHYIVRLRRPADGTRVAPRGGVAVGRPVAAISVGPNGVRVEPVVDATKIALAFFTMLGSMLIMLGRMRRAGRH